MSSDPEDYYRAIEPLAPEDKPSPVAIAVLWACGAVVIVLGIALLLAGISVLVGGHYWWLR